MIIPTPEFDPLFADDGVPFRDKMIQYIEYEFGDTLGNHAQLIRSEQGLDALSKMVSGQLQSNPSAKAA